MLSYSPVSYLKYCLLCCAILLSQLSYADTVWLKNNDRLTGTIVVLDRGKLLLKTDYAGTITLDVAKISTLESDRPLLVKPSVNASQQAKSLKRGPEGSVQLVNGEQPITLALENIYQMMPPKPLVEDFYLKGNVHLSADYKKKESDVKDYSVAVNNELRHGRWRHLMALEYDHEIKNDSKKTDTLDLQYDLDRFISEQWFWKGKAKYVNDKLEDLRKQETLGTGPGYQFWDNELGAFSLTTLFNHHHYKYADRTLKKFNSGTLSWNYNRYFLAKTLELYSTGEVGKPFISEVDYILDLEAGARYKVNSWASLTLKTEWDKIASKHGNLNDRRYLIGVGVGW